MDNAEETELSFPGAYSSGKGRSWERRIKERIAVLPGQEWDLNEFKTRIRRKVARGEARIEPGGFENLRRIKEARQAAAAAARQMQLQAQRSSGGYGGGDGGDYGSGGRSSP